MNGKTRNPFFEQLKAGFEEGIAHVRGELTLKTIEHPEAPPEISAETLVALRTEVAMSQAVFAKMLSTSIKTVQSWEQGKRIPSMATRRLIQVFVAEPEALCRVVGLPAIKATGFTVKSFPKGRRRIVKGAK